MEYLERLTADPGLGSNFVKTLFVVVAVIVLRTVAVRYIQSARWPDGRERLQWMTRVRLLTLPVLLLGVVFVWATELQTLALSAVAIAAAIVLATKELIMCLSGSVVRYMGQGYDVGDRIEVDGLRGDVVSFGLLTTTLLEIGPGHRKTGRAIVMPNSLLLGNAVVNETFTEDFVLHVITVPLDLDDEWEAAEALLLRVSEEVCAEHAEAAREHMERTAERLGLPAPAVEPRVLLQLPEPGKVSLVARVPTPAREKSRTEQEILRRFLRAYERGTSHGDPAP